MSEHEQPRSVSRSEWLTVGLVALSQIVAVSGFIWRMDAQVAELHVQLSGITVELHELNKAVTEGQVVAGKIVEHMNSVDRRLEYLESRRKD